MNNRIWHFAIGALVLAWTVWSALWQPEDALQVLAVILGHG